MKRIHVVFSICEIFIFLSAIAHVGIVFTGMLRYQDETSFPPEVAFVWLIPYAVAMLVLGLVWLIVFFATKRKDNRREE